MWKKILVAYTILFIIYSTITEIVIRSQIGIIGCVEKYIFSVGIISLNSANAVIWNLSYFIQCIFVLRKTHSMMPKSWF